MMSSNNNENRYEFNNIFTEKVKNINDQLSFMMNNTKYYVETDFTKKIKLKKNKPFLLNFNRSYDLYSDLIIEYEIGNKNDFKGIYRLPKEINNLR